MEDKGINVVLTDRVVTYKPTFPYIENIGGSLVASEIKLSNQQQRIMGNG